MGKASCRGSASCDIEIISHSYLAQIYPPECTFKVAVTAVTCFLHDYHQFPRMTWLGPIKCNFSAETA